MIARRARTMAEVPTNQSALLPQKRDPPVL